ncbi:placenta-specific protein 1 [Hyaena hyaena]|uniref:placenta-specific protein 1 n=1 Tax=Hyaena hyaena TaxID=95912 RepID=UPI0019229362|nr:placenta-specific protein 1 [Hyaena hyaena]XP_039095801.1 placenta-specific protein 1 [Hyaena hyaena]XP_039095802.1 placenta-specific protein 1 [Hyaena hyaena]XP_039095803.1 placenta-specific protein 1 [Hyaena hyaena]XP_039095804.1 placenta-specific protein 1 [Hyaena hyaena]XP_039095805.1 placenta-specific protein 1 [Hyaena hyaena]
MKVLELIGGMVFLTSVFSSCSAQNPMTVLCSTDWFMVTVHPFMLNNDVYVHFHELHLGLGCPANHVQPHMYQFTYRVTECGIRVKAVSQSMVIYNTELHYASKCTSSKYVIPLSCAAPLRSPWLTLPCPVNVASEAGTTTQNGEACYEVFTLSQSSQRPNCDCPPCVLNEEDDARAPRVAQGAHQVEAQVGQMVQPSSLVNMFEDWSLHSDDLIEFM